MEMKFVRLSHLAHMSMTIYEITVRRDNRLPWREKFIATHPGGSRSDISKPRGPAGCQPKTVPLGSRRANDRLSIGSRSPVKRKQGTEW